MAYYRKNRDDEKKEKYSAVGKPPVDKDNVHEADKVSVDENRIPYQGSAMENTSRGGRSVKLVESTGGFVRGGGAATSIRNGYKFTYGKKRKRR
jgi:hypothetical protein